MQVVVDCGAQSSIISGDLFDRICANKIACGRGRPEQRPSTVKLYGKGGTDHNELHVCISGMTVLEFSMDGLSVEAPVFIQPACEIPCLLGTNVLPKGCEG